MFALLLADVLWLPDWQTATVLGVVVVAGCYLARRGWQVLAAKKSGCGSCSTCPSNKTSLAATPGSLVAAGKPLITLDSLTRPKKTAK